ncbi:unnamed protein product [Urochloa decumbens]|uniref:non-specific serine/threonine protein kinase n=1 Tax=Urochloa decumbens TaxID=240449 RepID=A0ABC9G9B7_9POAL
MQPFWLCYMLLLLLLSTHYLLQASSVSFNFDFSQADHAPNINFQGDAYFNSSNQLIELTKSNRSAGLDNSVGRASYAQPVPIWNDVTGERASFTTTFSFHIETKNINNGNNGDGMAFFLGHYPSSIPSSSAGANLALFSTGASSTSANGVNRAVAVEFDTYMNAEYLDNSNNHIGIDLNSLISNASTNTNVPGKNLTSGLLMTCRITYDSSTKRLAADLRIGDADYHVEASADLRQLLPSEVAIGFSGATGIAQELHRVLSWSFNSTLDKSSPPAPPFSPAPENGPGDRGCALRYLHGECTECVLHGDISASNILLDGNYVAKLADFGLARLMDHAMELKTTCNLAGTPGYIDPDFISIGRRSRESDVYGFGIVLLETVSGRSPAAASVDHVSPSPLLKWVWTIQRSSAILEAADPRLRYESTSDQQDQMERVLQVALWCSHTDPTQRPSIKEAMRALESRHVLIPPLPLPGFMAGPSNLATDDISCM